MVSRCIRECILAVMKIFVVSNPPFLEEERECGKFIRSYQEIPYFCINALSLGSEEGGELFITAFQIDKPVIVSVLVLSLF